MHSLVAVARKAGPGKAGCQVVESRSKSLGLDHV